MTDSGLLRQVEQDVESHIRGLRAIDPDGRDEAYEALQDRLCRMVYNMRRADTAYNRQQRPRARVRPTIAR